MGIGRPHYLGSPDYQHSSPPAVGVLLVNLGTPAAPTAAALRPWLRQFLSDPRVIELPRALWWFVLNCLIVPLRSPKSAEAYQQVWDKDGSPLMAISQRQRDLIARELADEPVAVELGMSYGQPSIPFALRRLHERNCRHLIVLPLYPQYAASTIGSVFDAVADELKSWRWVPHLRMVSGYCQQPEYIDVLADSLRQHRAEHGAPRLTVFSFHGTQLAALQQGDPYHCQCHRTARQVAKALELGQHEWLVTFQSRFGKDPWLQPYTIDVMQQLPGKGIKDVQVVCPAFAADCLETLEEISGENRDEFVKAGGEKFSYVPALNESAAHISFLAELLRKEAGDWFAQLGHERDAQHLARREEHFRQTEQVTVGKVGFEVAESEQQQRQDQES